MDAAPVAPPDPLPALLQPWSRRTQAALASLMLLALALLGLSAWGSSRAATRPLEVSRSERLPRLDVNTADATQLRQVPGLNDGLARRIIAHRDANGRFRNLDELTAVKDIGPATLARIRPHLRVSVPETTEAVARTFPEASSVTSKGKKKPPAVPLDLNRATFEELLQLPNIGPERARKILEARQVAPFNSVDDLDKINGIGRKIIDGVRPHVYVTPRPKRDV